MAGMPAEDTVGEQQTHYMPSAQLGPRMVDPYHTGTLAAMYAQQTPARHPRRLTRTDDDLIDDLFRAADLAAQDL